MLMNITIGLLIPLLGTMLGAAFVFFMKKDMSARLQKSLLGFASGVMVAEELIPEASSGEHSNLSTIGFVIGFVLMMVLDVVMG